MLIFRVQVHIFPGVQVYIILVCIFPGSQVYNFPGVQVYILKDYRTLREVSVEEPKRLLCVVMV